MLIITRRVGESFKIGDDIEVTVLRVAGNQIRIGISAPSDVTVLREELSKEGASAGSPERRTGNK